MTVALDGQSLTLAEVVRVARGGEQVGLAPAAIGRMRVARAVVDETLAGGKAVYGLTTGVGAQTRTRVASGEIERFNHLMILGSRVGQGPAAAEDIVRAAMVCLANGLAKASSGVRPELAELIVSALNDRRHPAVRTLGSVGQADLAPLADLAHGILAGSGFDLAAGEGLALLDNNAFSTGSAALAVAGCEQLLDAADVAGALELEAFAANLTVLHPQVGETRPYRGLRATLARLGALLEGSYLWAEGAARNLQDPLTFRCLPQVHGAARDALEFTKVQLEIELNSFQGNPLVLVDEGRVISVANFDVLPLAAALDFLRIALAPVLTSACERMVKLLQAPFSGLPTGLATRPRTSEDALVEFGVVGQSLTAEARLLAHPVSFELASSTQQEGIEDRMTMAPLGARRLCEMVTLGERLVAIEFVVAAQAVDLRGAEPLGAGTGPAYERVRELVPRTAAGEPPPQDLEPVAELVRSGALAPPA